MFLKSLCEYSLGFGTKDESYPTVGRHSRRFKDWIEIFEPGNTTYPINECRIIHFVDIRWVLKRNMSHSNTRVNSLHVVQSTRRKMEVYSCKLLQCYLQQRRMKTFSTAKRINISYWSLKWVSIAFKLRQCLRDTFTIIDFNIIQIVFVVLVHKSELTQIKW